MPGPITKDDKFAFFAACNEKPVLPTCGEEGGGGATKRYNKHNRILKKKLHTYIGMQLNPTQK